MLYPAGVWRPTVRNKRRAHARLRLTDRQLFATRARAATLAVVVVAAVSVAYASIPDSAGVIHGCYNKLNGQLRVIDDAVSSCAPQRERNRLESNRSAGSHWCAGSRGAAGPSRSGRSGRVDCVWGFSRSRWWNRGTSRCSGTVGKLPLPPGSTRSSPKLPSTSSNPTPMRNARYAD